MKRIALTVALVGTIVVAGAVAARADVNDSWITTKAKIALLTTDGFSVSGANVDTVNGNVTIHGKVETTADRTKAEQTVRKVTGVKTVKNLLQVVPADVKELVAAKRLGRQGSRRSVPEDRHQDGGRQGRLGQQRRRASLREDRQPHREAARHRERLFRERRSSGRERDPDHRELGRDHPNGHLARARCPRRSPRRL